MIETPDSVETTGSDTLSICFVCTGNICRSPLADVILGRMARETVLSDGSLLADHIRISSAGTGPWHAGEPMDPRAAAVLGEHGYADHGHIARQFAVSWFDREDLIVQRVVVRNGFTNDLAEMLLRDIRRHLDWFATQPGLKPTLDGAGFHH